MLYKRDQGKCSYCGKEITQKESTIDHIIPKSKGGSNTWENICLACKPCNVFKDDRSPKEAKMKLLITPYNPKKSSGR
jgi:5-methylcytosine-specific restriction endonuclease McrA